MAPSTAAEKGAAHPGFSRYPGSEIVEYRQLEFAQTDLATGFADKNNPQAPARKSFEGKTTTIIYHLVGEQSALQVFRNYEQAFARAGLKTIVMALTSQYAVAKARLSAVGVGPVAPAGTNVGDAARARNRRVELVLR